MPASSLAELVLDMVGQLVLGLAAEGADASARGVLGSNDRAGEQRRERSLAMADIVVLAACYDFSVTEAERGQLAIRIREIFGREEMDVSVEELIARWEGPRAALQTETAFLAAVRSLADDLGARERRRVFDAAAAVLTSGAEGDPGEGAPFRRPDAKSPTEAVTLFGEALGVPSDVIDEVTAAARPRDA